jgi:glycosyltransferase involved in cell wall biosynthesis
MNITFIVPCKDFSGGLKVVATYGNKLMERGHAVRIFYPKRNLSLKNRIKRKIERILHRERDHLDFFKGRLYCVKQIRDTLLPDSDCLIATAFETARWIKDFPERCGQKFYLIQGYETWSAGQHPVDETFRYPFRKIVISNWLKQLVESKSGETDIPVIANGKDFFLPQNELIDPAEKKYDIGMIYSAVSVKQADIGLAALREVARYRPGIKVILFGSETPNPSDLPAGTDFFKKPAYDQIQKIYISTRIWVCTSRQEGFCLPALEAISLGCCVVSTDNLGIRDIVSDGKDGFIVETANQAALAERINLLLDEPDLQQTLRTAGLKRSNDFSWEHSADLFETYLKQHSADIKRSAELI